MSNYRCPNCKNSNYVEIEKIFDKRLLFLCSKCKICIFVEGNKFNRNLDEVYLDFLEQYDNGNFTKINELKNLLEQEKIIRPFYEIQKILEKNNLVKNVLLKKILFTEKDYLADFRIIDEIQNQKGSDVEDLPVNQKIIDYLKEVNINCLYKFQEESIIKILRGKDVIIIAPTASGKTEAFTIPIIERIRSELEEINNKNSANRILALFIYPTKALERDQLIKIEKIAKLLDISVKIFDGDIKTNERDQFYKNPPNILITNFDTIHYHLINNTRFARLLNTIKYMVIDEVHIYTGIFGSNIHFIMKRLERLLKTRRIQIIASSATLPNAEQFCNELFTRRLEIIKENGRKGRINFAILYPTLRTHRSLLLDLTKRMIKHGHKTIVFNNSHQSAELFAFHAKRNGIDIRVHRSGILPKVRKTIEELFKTDKLMVVSATPTLELGIDIGDIDSVISNIVPINRLIQRFGRAARKGQEGYAFLALGNDPISQYYKSHPEDYYLDQEIPYTDSSNPFVKEIQVLAMSMDKPISIFESKSLNDTIQILLSKKLIQLSENNFIPTARGMEVIKKFNLRGIGTSVYIYFNNRKIGERNLPQALEELYPNAIYFLGGTRFQVETSYISEYNDLELIKYAKLISIPKNYPYYTKPIVEEFPEILEIYEQKKIYEMEVKYCSLKIIKKITGYSNIEIGKEESKGKKIFFDEPIIYQYVTNGIIFKVPKPSNILLKYENNQNIEMSGYHASEHVLIEGSSMITGGASQDLGGISLGSSGIIVIHDSAIGGNGASKTLFERFEKAIDRAYKILSECSCTNEDGCPRCTYSYRCGNNNEFLHKKTAIEVLYRIMENEKIELTDIGLFEKAFI